MEQRHQFKLLLILLVFHKQRLLERLERSYLALVKMLLMVDLYCIQICQIQTKFRRYIVNISILIINFEY
jgi:hypothetical protein